MLYETGQETTTSCSASHTELDVIRLPGFYPPPVPKKQHG